MTDRSGEKLGWYAAWLGGFGWLPVLGIVWLVQGKSYEGLSSLTLFGCAFYLVWRVVPWNHPDTPYWKLMVPIYGLFVVSLYLVFRSAGGLEAIGLSWYALIWLAPVFLPFFVIGHRRWRDGDPTR